MPRFVFQKRETTADIKLVQGNRSIPKEIYYGFLYLYCILLRVEIRADSESIKESLFTRMAASLKAIFHLANSAELVA